MQGMIDPTSSLLSRLIDLTNERQRVISNNLANVNTPGYTRRVFDFEKALARVANGEGNLENLSGVVVKDDSAPARLDGNNINISRETTDMFENGMYHRLLNRALKAKINILNLAISGGR